MKRNSKGITLIALVITIIVIMILAAITINLLLGDNKIINKIERAVNEYNESKLIEEIEEEIASIMAEDIAEGKTTDLTTLFNNGEGKLEKRLEGIVVEEISEDYVKFVYKGFLFTVNNKLEVIKDGTKESEEEKIEVNLSTTEQNQEEVEIIINGATSDEIIVKIINPEGNETEGNSLSYKVTKNGVYEFKLITDKGKVIVKAVIVTNIKLEEPVMNILESSEYGLITSAAIEYGTNKIEIEYDDGGIVENYYSEDNGATWIKYEGEVCTSSDTIIAKSVVKGNEQNSTQKTFSISSDLASDAIVEGKFQTTGNSGYHSNGSTTKRITIDSSASDGLTDLIISYTLGGGAKPGWIVLTFINEDGTTTEFKNTEKMTIPQGSKELKITLYEGVQYAGKYTSYLNSMQVDFGPKFEEETCYATIKKDGIHEEYKNIEIKPAKQAKETYYKIDDGEFIKYNLGEKIRVEVGQTIYAKSVNQYNQESLLKQHSTTYSDNILVNGKFQTTGNSGYHSNGSTTKRITIDSSASDGLTDLAISYTLGGGAKPGWIVLTFINEDGTTTEFKNTEKMTIPQGSKELKITLYEGVQYAGKYTSYLNSIQVI